jgi:hypothetical protein
MYPHSTRYDANEVAPGVTEVLACGTAVLRSGQAPGLYQPLHPTAVKR